MITTNRTRLPKQTNQGSTSRGEPVDREVLAAAAERRLKASNERGIKTHTVQQRSKAELPDNIGDAPLKWQVG